MKRILLSGLAATGMMFGALSVGGTTVNGAQDKVTICHAAGQAGTQKFVSLTIAYNAAYGEAGHFLEPGTPNAGHEADSEGECKGPDTVIVPEVEYTKATCDAAGTATPVEIPGQVEWFEREDGGWTATALPGNVIGGDSSTFGPPEPQLSGDEACPTTTTSSSTPDEVVESGGPVPPTAPENRPPASTAVAAAGPVPAQPAPAQAAPTQLPSTGSSSWVLALIAIGLVLAGSGIVKFSRRPS